MNRDEYFQRYVDYIRNTGGSPTVEQFDDDWEPIGQNVREDLKQLGYAYEMDGKIYPK